MTTMAPLTASWSADQLEQELTELFVQLFTEHLLDTAQEINVYGAPHLGSPALIEREVSADGLAILRDYEVEDYKIRFLHLAFRHRNLMRGLHFLRTYLRVLYADSWYVDQMWQKKTEDYPDFLRTVGQIDYDGEDLSDFFLTSRVIVDLDTASVPDLLIRSLRSVVAARIHLTVRVAKFFSNGMVFGGVAGCAQVKYSSGELQL